MRLGLISDVHGNRIALDAVIADGDDAGVESWWVLGDLVAIGPDPVSTLDRLTALPGVRFVSGNTDRYVVTGDRPHPYPEEVEADPGLRPLFDEVEASFAWTTAALAGTSWLDWLADLPTEQRLELPDGTRLLGIHASVGSDDHAGIDPTIPDDELAALLDGAGADIVLGGHTHRPTDRRVDGVRAVNLGSVSNPITSDLRASYVVIDVDGEDHRLAHRRVAYDHDAFVARTEATDHPATPYITSFQRGAQVRHPA